MPFYHTAFGLQLVSNVAIPGLLVRPPGSTYDLRIWLRVHPPWLGETEESFHEPWYISPYRDSLDRPTLQIWQLMQDQFLRFHYADGTEFFLDRSGTEIWATWPNGLTLEDILPYLCGNILGFVQRLRGVTCLHACAIEDHGRAFALVGPAGAGKSTCAASFLQLGHRVLADDVVPVLETHGEFLVQPAHPRIWLCPDIVRSLYGSEESLPILTPSWEKRYIDMSSNGMSFEEESVPLAALYLLGERMDDPEAPFLETVSAREAMIALVSNTYVNLLIDKEMRAREFALLGRVVAHVPVRRVRPHSDQARLPRLCETILKDFRSCSTTAAASR